MDSVKSILIFLGGYLELEDTIFRRRGCISDGGSLIQLEEGVHLGRRREDTIFKMGSISTRARRVHFRRRECISEGGGLL